MSKDPLDLLIPEQKVLEVRFKFIEDDTLRTNVSIAFRYIIFLIALESKFTLPSVIIYSLYKDIILYTATVVESCLHYCLDMHIEKGVVKSSDVMPFEWKDSHCNDLYSISDTEKVCGVIRHKKHEGLTRTTQSKTVNEALLRSKLLDRTIFDQAEKLRQKRNRIHLVGLDGTDDAYVKKDVEESFTNAKNIMEKVEILLSGLK